MDNVIFSLGFSNTDIRSSIQICIGSNNWARVDSIHTLILHQWQHLTGTFNGTHINIYLNGSLANNHIPLDKQFTDAWPHSVYRADNYVGKSAWSVDGY